MTIYLVSVLCWKLVEYILTRKDNLEKSEYSLGVFCEPQYIVECGISWCVVCLMDYAEQVEHSCNISEEM